MKQRRINACLLFNVNATFFCRLHLDIFIGNLSILQGDSKNENEISLSFHICMINRDCMTIDHRSGIADKTGKRESDR